VSIKLETIGVIHSPFKEKFSVPRQPGLIKHATMELELYKPYSHPDSVKDLSQYTHLWLLFIFHQHQDTNWRPLIRPPRLGGNQKTGVFASRSSYRPNPIGMSAVELRKVTALNNSVKLELTVADLVDGTPIIDIKPYIPYSDVIPQAHGGMAHQPPEQLAVSFSADALKSIKQHQTHYPDLKLFIIEVLSQDPRPAYKKQSEDNKLYGVKLYNFDVKWRIDNNEVYVERILQLTD
jgi:tRNA-Thr(GGU) m(6)t(6)A37 methyltransferase TsaA